MSRKKEPGELRQNTQNDCVCCERLDADAERAECASGAGENLLASVGLALCDRRRPAHAVRDSGDQPRLQQERLSRPRALTRRNRTLLDVFQHPLAQRPGVDQYVSPAQHCEWADRSASALAATRALPDLIRAYSNRVVQCPLVRL